MKLKVTETAEAVTNVRMITIASALMVDSEDQPPTLTGKANRQLNGNGNLGDDIANKLAKNRNQTCNQRI